MHVFFIFLGILVVTQDILSVDLLPRGFSTVEHPDYFVLNLSYGRNPPKETKMRYPTHRDVIALSQRLRDTTYRQLMKDWQLVDFWAAKAYFYKAKYIIGRKSLLGTLALSNEPSKKITYVRDDNCEARVFIEYYGDKLFKIEERFPRIYSHIFYLHFSSQDSGVADELEIRWIGGQFFVCYTQDIPFTLDALPGKQQTVLKSEERLMDVDKARCWIDPGVWECQKQRRKVLINQLNDNRFMWERIARNWPYLDDNGKKKADVFKENATVDITDAGMIELTVNRRKLPKPRFKSNYAALMMDDLLLTLHDSLDDRNLDCMALMFYRFDNDVFSKEDQLQPAHKLDPRMPKFILPHHEVEIKL